MNYPASRWLRLISCFASWMLAFGLLVNPVWGKGKPNIIFIMVDDLGYADLACYGSRSVQTPNLDRLAAEGIRFEQAYSGCTVCAPSRSVLMTGLHMGHTPVRLNTGGVPLPDENLTVAEVLKKAGYATGGFGKWGLGDLDTEGVPEKQGFDRFFGYYHQVHAHSFYPEFLIRSGTKVPLPGNQGFYDQESSKGFVPDRSKESGSEFQFSQYVIFDEMLDFIRDNKDRPFFCYAPWTPPHGKYEMPGSDPAAAQYRKRPWSEKAQVIAAMVGMIDRQVGQVLELLKELGIDDRTVVFFCSDNGAAERLEGELDSSGPLRGSKKTFYEGGIRSPFIARWPGTIPGGRVSQHLTYFPDVMPTLAELAEATAPAGVDGISLVPLLLGDSSRQRQHEYLYWEWELYVTAKGHPEPNGLMQAIRVGDWKLVRHRSNEPWELYNLANDLSESRDLSTEEPEQLQRLLALLQSARVEPEAQQEPDKPEGQKYR